MPQYKWIPQEFIQNAFQPHVAVMSSPTVEETIQKNNLSFVELLQPFSKLNAEAYIHDPTGGSAPIKNLRISMLDVHYRPPPPTAARKLLNHVVSHAVDQGTVSVTAGDVTLEIPAAVPWFEAWRDAFLHVQFPSDHEFTKHFVACMIVIASHEPHPMEAVEKMNLSISQMQSTTPAKLPKWISPNIMRYYVVLHDKWEHPRTMAEKVYESLKGIYGIDKCFLLETNSRKMESIDTEMAMSDPWLQFLSLPSMTASEAEGEFPQTPSDVAPISGMPSQLLNTDVEPPEAATEVAFHPLSPSAETLPTPQDTKEKEWPELVASSLATRHGAYLTSQDLEQLHRLIQEFCFRALIPYVEMEINRLTDIVRRKNVSNKKGVSRSLFSATKRWFGSNKPGQAAVAANAVIYSPDSPEIQLRRLGDLYFMFGHYSMAFQAYHSVKRDFNADQAWLYYAGALEMAALSAFMLGEFTKKTYEYMDEAINIYLSSCRMPQFATRATLLSTECLRGMRLAGEAAKQLIRMTSEDSDLRSAILLEQAAYFFLSVEKSPMGRKYAFHIVLAGHRFSKAGQRKHTLRCYEQAYQIYKDRDWSLAEDHINFTIGRQAAFLNSTNSAIVAFSKLLAPSFQQTALQQATFLRELNATYATNSDPNSIGVLPELPLPAIDGNNTKVLFIPLPPVTTPGKEVASSCTLQMNLETTVQPKWGKLEEMTVFEAQGCVPMTFKPTIVLYSGYTDNSSRPLAVVAEMVYVEFKLTNPLKIVLVLRDLKLFWQFTSVDGTISTNEQQNQVDKCVHTNSLDSVILQPHSSQDVALSLTPLQVGKLDVRGIIYALHGQQPSEEASTPSSSISTIGKQLIVVQGRKARPKDRTSQKPGIDHRLFIQVIDAAPCLQVTFTEIHSEVLSGEMQAVTVDMTNHGRCALTNIYLATSTPHLYSFHSIAKKASPRENMSLKDQFRKQFVTPIALPDVFNNSLQPAQAFSFIIWIRAPQKKGPVELDLQIYYENVNPKMVPRYRLVRHGWQLTVQEALRDCVNTEISEATDKPNALNFGLQVKNPNHVHHTMVSVISLIEVSFLSMRWKLDPHVNAPRIMLHGQESVDFSLRATKTLLDGNNAQRFASVSFAPSKLVTKQSNKAYKDFVLRSADKVVALDGDMEENIVSAPKVSEHFNEGTLVLRWSAQLGDSSGNTRTTTGFHKIVIEKIPPLVEEDEIFAEPLGLLRLIKSDSAKEELRRRKEIGILEINQKLVTYTIQYEPIVYHDFKKEKISTVPVSLIIASCADSNLQVLIRLWGPHNQFFQSVPPNHSLPFRWIGDAGRLVRQISPQGVVYVPLKVAFTRPGTFDLSSGIELLVKNSEGTNNCDYTMQTWRLSSNIIVIN